MKIKSKNKDLEQLKAPQAIVHIKHSITLKQYKIWIILLQHYKNSLDLGDIADEEGFMHISKADLEQKLGCELVDEELKKDSAYELVKEELKRDFEKLRKEPIIANYLEKDGTPVIHGMGFISEWKITSKTIKYKIPSLLKSIMLGLDKPKAIFQLINWQIFNHFSGKYEAIIYKLCRDYVGIKRTPYMTIEEFRSYMGIQSTEYREFMRLNEWVISGPCKKINNSKLSDISVDVNFNRKGKKVIGLYFGVEYRNQKTIPFAEFEPNPAFRFSKVTIESSTQMEYLVLRESEEIALCIERANEYAESQEKIGKFVNYGGLYRKAITEGWHTNFKEKKEKRLALEYKEKENKDQEEKEEKEEKEKANKDKEIKKKIEEKLSIFKALPEEKKTILRNEFSKTLTDIIRKNFEKNGETAPMHRYNFCLFLEQKDI